MNALLALALLSPASAGWLESNPRYADYQREQNESRRLENEARGRVAWINNEEFLISVYGQVQRFSLSDLTPKAATAVDFPTGGGGPRRPGRPGVPRGTSVLSDKSPDGTLTLQTDRYNLTLKQEGQPDRVITTDGGEQAKIRNGFVPWVYGEEWGQTEALGFSPDGKRFWFYRFDLREVKPYFLLNNFTDTVNAPFAMEYPKAGAPNPQAEVWVADAPEWRPRKLLGTQEPEHAYLFDIQWSPDGTALLMQRSDRLQQVREWLAVDPATGNQRVLWKETNPGGWIYYQWMPKLTGPKTLFTVEDNGFFNYAEIEWPSGRVTRLTQNRFDVGPVVHQTENDLFYLAGSGPHPHQMQLHRFTRKDQRDVRLTDPQFHHAAWISPDAKHVIVRRESVGHAPDYQLISLVSRRGPVPLVAAKPEHQEATSRRRAFTYKSADGLFDLQGTLDLPPGFDPNQQYPLIAQVYNGPETIGVSPSWSAADGLTGFGCIVAKLESRGGMGRGRAFRNAAYGKLGVAEIDDLAAGIRAAVKLGFVDPTRVGIEGTSYGGYAAAMAVLRHPDVFRAGAASSPVMDWRHYDTIYTERYMGLPQGNPEGYKAGSALTYAKDLRAELLLFAGLRDDNVHPQNTFEFVREARRERKAIELHVGPNEGHTFVGLEPMMRFFWTHLKMGE